MNNEQRKKYITEIARYLMQFEDKEIFIVWEMFQAYTKRTQKEKEKKI